MQNKATRVWATVIEDGELVEWRENRDSVLTAEQTARQYLQNRVELGLAPEGRERVVSRVIPPWEDVTDHDPIDPQITMKRVEVQFGSAVRMPNGKDTVTWCEDRAQAIGTTERFNHITTKLHEDDGLVARLVQRTASYGPTQDVS